MLLVMALGLICYMDSWVTHNTFWEQNNQNESIAYISCKMALFFPSDFECVIPIHFLEAMKYHD